jgi:hypothetical protein
MDRREFLASGAALAAAGMTAATARAETYVELPNSPHFVISPDIYCCVYDDMVKQIRVGDWEFWVYRQLNRWDKANDKGFLEMEVAQIGTPKYSQWYESWRDEYGWKKLPPHAVLRGRVEGATPKFRAEMYYPMFGPFAHTAWKNMPGKTVKP